MEKLKVKKTPWSVEYYCSNELCKYKENELFMPGQPIPDMLKMHFCLECGGILRLSEIGKKQ